MTATPDPRQATLGVVGAGAMGRGIVQVAVAGGCAVRLFDVDAAQVADAVAFVAGMLDRAVERERMSAEEAKAAKGRIETVPSLGDLAPCGIVIEAATENTEIKRGIYAELEAVLAEDAIIATNTSSLSVTTLASGLERPGRFAGMHFFNPVPLMRLVEVIDGELTAPETGDALMALGEIMTRVPVRMRDAPGFLVNQVGRGYNIEAAHIHSEQVADFAAIDRLLTEGAGFRMGPFTLLDLTGLDVTHPATELIYRQFFEEPRYRPNVMMRARMEAGILGRKTNRGFYDYPDGRQDFPEEAPPPAYDGRPVWISGAEEDGRRALAKIVSGTGAPIDEGDGPGPDSLILVTPVGEDVTAAAAAQGLDARRTLGVDTVVGLATRRTVMTNPATQAEWRDAALGLMAADGVPATAIRDCPGFVCQRIVAMICNIGCQIAQFGTAAPEDIDRAVVLGLNYPSGPLALGDSVGPKTILRILESLSRLTGDPRYRPSPWLRRRAQLGLSLLDAEI